LVIDKHWCWGGWGDECQVDVQVLKTCQIMVRLNATNYGVSTRFWKFHFWLTTSSTRECDVYRTGDIRCRNTLYMVTYFVVSPSKSSAHRNQCVLTLFFSGGGNWCTNHDTIRSGRSYKLFDILMIISVMGYYITKKITLKYKPCILTLSREKQ